jgi:2-succinyl-5-enolpyruvyl-6-hydroxy-3-cyclohexene-1-carboxylate synthase
MAQGPGHWADQARVAADVAARLRLSGAPAPRPAGAPPGRWLDAWLRADAAACAAVDAIVDDDQALSEPRLARDLLRDIPAGALAWIGSSMPIRDADCVMRPRADIRVLASRGASGIDGTTSSAAGAALAHQADGGGPAFALAGDLAFVHDAAGLALGPQEPRPDLCLIVVNNDGGAIFSALEQARFAGPFERVFGTPHGTDVAQLAGAFGLPCTRAETAEDLAKAMAETEPGSGLRIVEVRTGRAAQTELRARIRQAAAAALAARLHPRM